MFTCIQRGHCVKSVQIWSFFRSVFFRIWTEYGKYGPDQDQIWTLFTQWELFERKCATALVFWFGITTPVDIIVISLEKSSDLIVFFHEMVKIIVDFLKYWLLQNSFNEKFPPAKVFILCHIK